MTATKDRHILEDGHVLLREFPEEGSHQEIQLGEP
jgi:hypothetical protein